MGLTGEQAKQIDDFVCSECSSEDLKKSHNTYAASPLSNGKVVCSWLVLAVVDWLLTCEKMEFVVVLRFS